MVLTGIQIGCSLTVIWQPFIETLHLSEGRSLKPVILAKDRCIQLVGLFFDKRYIYLGWHINNPPIEQFH